MTSFIVIVLFIKKSKLSLLMHQWIFKFPGMCLIFNNISNFASNLSIQIIHWLLEFCVILYNAKSDIFYLVCYEYRNVTNESDSLVVFTDINLHSVDWCDRFIILASVHFAFLFQLFQLFIVYGLLMDL